MTMISQTTTNSIQTSRYSKTQSPAFTLIEMIIVMAIISAMMTVVIPYATNSRSSAQLKLTAIDLALTIDYAINHATHKKKPTRILIDTKTPAFSIETATSTDPLIFDSAPQITPATTVLPKPLRFTDFKGLTHANKNWQIIFDPDEPWPKALITLASDNAEISVNIRGKYVTATDPVPY
jgi:prepilin-type N-terminal cleavage/methylation domain-containing protein